jgi:hypothetical protein
MNSRTIGQIFVWLVGVTLCSRGFAQQYPSVDGRQNPLSQMSPVGMAAEWSRGLGIDRPPYFQPVQLSLPDGCQLAVYHGPQRAPVELSKPGQVSLLVGQTYRYLVTGVADFPGVEFYPSVELIDRLHPPAGQADQFPVTLELTAEEFELAAKGRLITKVVYLEQPDRVPTASLESATRTIDLPPTENAIAHADVLGRPIAIVRLGGRTPDPHRPDPQFFGMGAPVRLGPTPRAE